MMAVDPMAALDRVPRDLWKWIYLPDKENSCWEWAGKPKSNGYGSITIKRKPHIAHRVIYEFSIGKIQDGMELDHLCRNRICVNPNHLEPVTHLENMLRGVGIVAVASRKTHCPKGHPLSGDNLHPYYLKRGHRQCKICHMENCRKAAARQHARERLEREKRK